MLWIRIGFNTDPDPGSQTNVGITDLKLYFLQCYSLNTRSPKSFFSNFCRIFEYVASVEPLNKDQETIFFLQLEVPFLGADEKDPLVLTGGRVANFFISSNFDLIFLQIVLEMDQKQNL